MITLPEVLTLFAGAVAGGFINGLAGFGTALFALGFFLSIMSPVEAVAITVVLSVATGLQGVWLVRHAILAHPARLARFLLPGLLGVPVGIALLKLVDADNLKLVVAIFLLLYGGYFFARAQLPRIATRRPVTDCLVGLSGGILGGAASLSGALPTMWCTLRGWPKAETRAVLQPFNVTILTVTAIMLASEGAYTAKTLTWLAMTLPCALLAAQAGIWVFRHIPEALFTRLLIALTLVSGLVLLIRIAI